MRHAMVRVIHTDAEVTLTVVRSAELSPNLKALFNESEERAALEVHAAKLEQQVMRTGLVWRRSIFHRSSPEPKR